MNKLVLVLFLLTSQFVFAQDQMYNICPIKVGQEVPSVSLQNIAGEDVTLSSIVSEQPTVVVFYRGAWCPYCTKHLAELNDAKADIEKLGYQIIGVTVDKAEKLALSNEKSGSDITVFSDAKLDAIKAFGLDWNVGDELYGKYKDKYKLDLEEWSGQDHHSLPVPAIFIIKDNVVEFQYVNPDYSTRLKPESIIALIGTI